MQIAKIAMVFAVMCVSSAVWAQARPAADVRTSIPVPPELSPWVDWVMYDTPDLRCPSLDGQRHCIWPGDLAVSVQSKGALFVYDVFVDRRTSVMLPGNKDFWPQDVEVDGGAGVLTKAGDMPTILVDAGQHRITGRFSWSSTPEVLAVPDDVARVSLNILDEDVDFPRVEQGKLWLGKSGVGDEATADTVRATIYRRFTDGVPVGVRTRIQLNVSGRAREISLGKVLLEGSIPTQVESSLPMRLPPDGDVSVFVRPGSHEIFVQSVIPRAVSAITVPSPSPNFYDPQEVWVWVPDEQVRSVRVDGINAVDPERTSLPSDWHGSATYLVEPGAKMTLAETRRGMAEPAPNMITLSRDLWMDLDGEGYTVRDSIKGEMNQGWRLDHGASAVLGRVYDNQESADILVTKEPGKTFSGVEIRRPQLDLTAELRMDGVRTSVPIVGWNHDVQSLRANLRLPPGWTLLGGSGVDRMPGTWLESWTLFDFFFVLMVALTLGKLFGWAWAPVTLLALCLSHGHEDAPEWIWIGLLVTLAILRVVPQGWIRKSFVVLRAMMLVLLVVVFAPYARDQIRYALHPQVAEPSSSSYFSDGFLSKGDFGAAPMAEPTAVMEAPMAPELEEEWDEGKSVDLANVVERKISKAGSKKSDRGQIQYQSLQQVDPQAVVQTGPGLPNWSWGSWELQWTGPVRKDHTIELWMIGPTMNRVLTVVRVFLLLLLALLMFAPREMYWSEPVAIRKTFLTKLLGMAAVWVAVGMLPSAARAQEPVQAIQTANNVNFEVLGSTTPVGMLEQLKRRLVEETLCNGPCAVASRARIEVDGVALTMTAEVHAEKRTGWHLPGPADPLRITEVRVDGRVTQALRRGANGLAMVRLEPGRHTIEVRGVLVNRNVVTLQFRDETRPQWVEFKSAEWTADGIGPDGVPDNSIQLTRRVESGAEDAALSTDLPPWFQVERRLELGLPWRIRTVVTRVDGSRPQLVKVPLISGEKIISEDVRMENSRALVDFARGMSAIEFVSEIPVTPKVSLVAPTGEPFTETWYVQCSRIWRCGYGNLPRIEDVTDGVYQPMWKPWPGEKLEIDVTRPQGAPGQAVTVDEVEYVVTPGKRLLQAQLSLKVRASQGGAHEITLPEGAELQKVTVDGEVRTIRPRERVVSLPVKPGVQSFVLSWQQPWERGIHEVAPAVKMSSGAVNVATRMELGEDRWLLWAHGPQWGPAILFWSHLAILLVMAFFLGRIRNLPVRTWEWLLLVIGLSQLPVIAGLPILMWFGLLSWRGRHTAVEWWKFNLAQLAALALTLVSLTVLYSAIHFNLLVDIDMQVEGANSNNNMLRWYVDQTGPDLATPGIVSLPILAFRIAMLLWAFWLVSRLIKWARWGWGEFSRDGFWRDYPRTERPGRGRVAKGPAGVSGVPAASGADGDAGVESEKPAGGPAGLPVGKAARPVRTASSVGASPEEPPQKRRDTSTMPGAPIPSEPKPEEPSEG